MEIGDLVGGETHGGNQYDYIVVGSGGRIISAMNVSPIATAAMIDRGDNVIMARGSPLTDWYDGGQVVARPENPSRQVGDRIVDVPPGSYVWFDGDRHLVDDGEVDLSGSQPGVYRVRIESFPALDGALEIEIAA